MNKYKLVIIQKKKAKSILKCNLNNFNKKDLQYRYSCDLLTYT